MENDEEEKNRHEVDMADLDDEISVSSDSSSSIESSKPWQKKKSPSSNSEGTNFSSPFNEISLVASLPSRIIKGKPKKKKKKRHSQYDSNDDDSHLDIHVRVTFASTGSGSQASRQSFEHDLSPIKKKNKVLDGESIRKKPKNLKTGNDLDKKNKIRSSAENDQSVPKKKDEFNSIPKKKKETSVSLLNETMMNANKSPTTVRNTSASGIDNSKPSSLLRVDNNGRKNPNKKRERRDRDIRENSPRYPTTEHDMQNNDFNVKAKSNESLSTEQVLGGLEKVMGILFDKSKDNKIDSDDDSDVRYDFFDKDKDGKIVHQSWIPMFPEDFKSRQKQWPLSWWGIVEPSRKLMYPESDHSHAQGNGGYAGNPYQNPQHLSNSNHANSSMSSMPYPAGNEANPQFHRDFNNPPYNNSRHRGQEGWGNSNSNESRGVDGRGGWPDRNQFRGPPGRTGMDQWGRDSSYRN